MYHVSVLVLVSSAYAARDHTWAKTFAGNSLQHQADDLFSTLLVVSTVIKTLLITPVRDFVLGFMQLNEASLKSRTLRHLIFLSPSNTFSFITVLSLCNQNLGQVLRQIKTLLLVPHQGFTESAHFQAAWSLWNCLISVLDDRILNHPLADCGHEPNKDPLMLQGQRIMVFAV